MIAQDFTLLVSGSVAFCRIGVRCDWCCHDVIVTWLCKLGVEIDVIVE